MKDDVKVAEQSAHSVQRQVDADEARGYHGETVDETPRENYTVAGVVAGKPTPEFTVLEKQ